MASGRAVYEIGTKIRVSMTARVGTRLNEGAFGTTKVTSTSREGAAHYVFLGSTRVTGDKSPGGTITVAFDAEVTGTYQSGDLITTEVRELESYVTHVLYLSTYDVSIIDKESAVMPYEIGSRVHVKLTARIQAVSQAIVGLSGCREVIETSGGAWTHFLYLGSDKITGTAGPKNIGDIVQAEFDAMVTGDYKENRSLTTQVREIREDGSYAFTHYLYLDSKDITPLPVITGGEKPASVPGTRLRNTAEQIESADILKRIAELEDSSPVKKVTIRRSNTGNRFAEYTLFKDQEAARQYMDERDYNLDRFTITGGPAPLSLEDQEELNQLKNLNDDGRNQFGSSRWITSSVKLYNDEYFTGEWARQQTMDKLGIARYRLDEWPLSQIDWNEAVTDLLENNYLRVEFGSQNFYGPESTA